MAINSPIPANLAAECRKAARIIDSFIRPADSGKYNPDSVIPDSILTNCRGIAVLSILKAGFLFSGRAGSGLVVARLPDGSWSAPSAIGSAGMGFGGQIGAELTDFVIILNTQDAVKAFSHGGNVTVGGNLSVAAGPVGRNAEAAGTVGNLAAIYSYSKTRGLFAGVSIEGSAIVERKDTNATFYGRRVTAHELLTGQVASPPQAEDLYNALNSRSLSGSRASFSSTGNMQSSYSAPGSQYNLDTDNGYRHTPDYGRAQPASYTGGSALHSDSAGGFLSGNQQQTSHAPTSTQSRFAQPPTTYGTSPASQQQHMQQQFQNAPYHQAPQTPQSTSQRSGFNYMAANTTQPPVTRPPPIAPRPGEDRAVALYAFAGEREGDLPFSKGDIIVVVERKESANDWWRGRCNGREGVFPANYVRLT